MIRDSDVVMFLGFGYSKENLRRLDFGNCARKGARVLGSVYRCPDYWRYLSEHLHDPERFVPVTPHESINFPARYALAEMCSLANRD
jgi:hypothetical protein